MRKPDTRTLNELMDQARDNTKLSIRSNIPGIVKGVAEIGGRACCDVQLSPQQILDSGDLDDLPLVERVPIGYLTMGAITIRAPLEIGQGVMCHVSDRQLDLFLTSGGKTYRPNRGTIHDENDICAYPTLQPNHKEPKVQMNPGELYIGDHTGAATYMRINTQTGEIQVSTTKEVSVDAGPVGTIKLKALNIELDTPGIVGGPYQIFGVNVAGVATHLGNNAGGPVVWTDNPAAGVKGANLK